MGKAEFSLLMQMAAYSALISKVIRRLAMQETIGSPTTHVFRTVCPRP